MGDATFVGVRCCAQCNQGAGPEVLPGSSERSHDGKTNRGFRSLAALTLLLFVHPAGATNGINLVGFGAESGAMGGADVAMIRDSAALVINPAGLHQIEESQLDFSVDPYYFVDVSHSDSLGNEARNEPRAGGFLSLGYARRVNEKFVVGAGMYVAGGLGFRYENLESGYGTRGDIVTRFSVIRFAPGLAWSPNAHLALGASLSVNYATARQKYFLDSSVFNPLDASQSLFGTRLENLSAIGLGANLGLRYAMGGGVTLGLTYRSRSKLDLDGGRLTVNYEALGAGRIEYRDVALHGISVPQDVQLGILFAPAEKWLLSAEWNWIHWSQALRQFRVEAREPDSNPQPLLIPSEIEQVQPLELRDQHVYSIGVCYEPDDKTRWRAGYNYARQPVPERNLTPLVAAIPERHVSLGWGRELSDQLDLNLTLFYIAPISVRYSNPATPISTDARETHETLTVQITFTRRW